MESKFVMDELDETFLDEVVADFKESAEGYIERPIDLPDGTEAKIRIVMAAKSSNYIFKGVFENGEFSGEKFIMECSRSRCTIIISPENF